MDENCVNLQGIGDTDAMRAKYSVYRDFISSFHCYGASAAINKPSWRESPCDNISSLLLMIKEESIYSMMVQSKLYYQLEGCYIVNTYFSLLPLYFCLLPVCV